MPASDEDGKLTRLMNKQNIGNLALSYGFKIPQMRVLHKTDDIPNDINYPVFTKSLKSIDGGKKEECKCNNSEELKAVLRNCLSDAF